MFRNLLVLAGSVPLAVLLGAMLFERWRRRAAGARLPVTEKLLRSPGHSLSQEVEKLREEWMTWGVGGCRRRRSRKSLTNWSSGVGMGGFEGAGEQNLKR